MSRRPFSRSILLAVVPVSALLPIAPAAPGDTIWTSSYGVPERGERAVASVVAPDGSRLYMTGVQTEGEESDFFTVASDAATGSQAWAATYDAGPHDHAMAIAVAPDGSRVYVVGLSEHAETAADYVTIAYDAATGEQLWDARYSGTGHKGDVPSCIAASDDSVYVTGWSRGDGSWDFASVAYDVATGEERWVARFTHRRSEDYARGCVLAPDGSAFFVTGVTHIGRDPASAMTIAYSSSSGGVIWRDRFDTQHLAWDEGFAMAASADGAHVYVVGSSNRRAAGFLTIQYEATSGFVEWRRIDEARFGLAFDVAVTPVGESVFVTGSSEGKVGTVAYSTATGRELWKQKHAARGYGRGDSVAVSPDGVTVYVAGSHEERSLIFAYDAASGATVWTDQAPGSSWNSVSTSPDGAALYVTGIIVDTDLNAYAAAYEA